jgi:hypothetical protein
MADWVSRHPTPIGGARAIEVAIKALRERDATPR